MHTRFKLLMASLVIATTTSIASAQVEKAAARANRALWGSCGATIKAVLERQAGVEEVQIDQQKNIVFVTYKPNTHFDPAILRDAAEKADASFVLIQIVAKGHIIEEGSKHYLVAGDDRFLIIEPPADKPLPAEPEKEFTVIASVDDSEVPVKVKVIQARLPQPEGESAAQ